MPAKPPVFNLGEQQSWIYKVDPAGIILSKELTEVPEDVNKFYSENVAKQTRELIVNVLS